LLGVHIASTAGPRLRSLAIIDHIGRSGPGATAAVRASLDRLDHRASSAREYLEILRAEGLPGDPRCFWEAVFEHEFGPGRGGPPATSKAACLEDFADLRSRDWRSLWPALTLPATLIRCRAGVDRGLFVPSAELKRFREEAPAVEVVEVDSDHYTVMTDERTASAVAALLGRSS
jgi:hypothetical protein